MAVMREIGFNPDSREWFVQCPKCVEDIPIAVEGMVGLFSATCLTCSTPMLGAVTIASMRR